LTPSKPARNLIFKPLSLLYPNYSKPLKLPLTTFISQKILSQNSSKGSTKALLASRSKEKFWKYYSSCIKNLTTPKNCC